MIAFPCLLASSSLFKKVIHYNEPKNQLGFRQERTKEVFPIAIASHLEKEKKKNNGV